jgi:branched-chain amino acid transport system substrate-binding protein
MNRLTGRILKTLTVAAMGLFAVVPGAMAQERIRVGVVGQFSGPFSVAGKAYQQTIEAFTSVYGTRVGGRDVEFIYRDVGGANASVAKQLTEELIVRDKVSIIAGFFLSPESLAAAPVLTETKTPAVVFIGSSVAIPTSSPYIIRSANTLLQAGYVEAEWAMNYGFKRAYLSVADYSPSDDLLAAFKKRYLQLGGEIVGEDRIPLNTVDFSPFIERAARAKPTFYNTYVPGGTTVVNMLKAAVAQGLTGRKDLAIIGQSQLEEVTLSLFDDSVIGMLDALPYAIAAPGAENKKYKDAFRAKFGASAIPSYYGASAWDGMLVLYNMIRAQEGKPFDGKAAIDASLGYKVEGARSEFMIEPDTRSATLDYYVRRAVKGPDGKLMLEIADTFKALKSIP